MAATYRGFDLPFSKIEFDSPVEAGKNVTFPGTDGTLFMPFGRRQRSITVRGRLINTNRAGLLSFLRQFPSNCQGPLVCDENARFDDVRCIRATYSPPMADGSAAAEANLTAEYELQLEQLFQRQPET